MIEEPRETAGMHPRPQHGGGGIAADITAMIITFNEEANIARTLEAVAWVPEILVIDSGSTDQTLAIVARYPNARVVTRPFDTFADQCNFGLTQVRTSWVLSLDADYELTESLASEMRDLEPGGDVAGYRARFVYRVYGRPLRATLYPPRVVLYRRERARYGNEGHGHRVSIDGEVRTLQAAIYHDDRKPLSRWFASQLKYVRQEVDFLLEAPRGELKRSDRIRLMAWPAPILVFFATLLWKRCIFDGWPGWLYVLQRTAVEVMIAIEIVDRRLRKSVATHPAQRDDT